jgi:hypothetical protein
VREAHRGPSTEDGRAFAPAGRGEHDNRSVSGGTLQGKSLGIDGPWLEFAGSEQQEASDVRHEIASLAVPDRQAERNLALVIS